MSRTGLLLLLIGLVGLAGCHRAEQGRFRKKFMDKPAPDFELTALDGGKVKLSAYRGKPVIVTFWGHGCPPCRAEAPHLSRVAEEHAKDGLVVLAVNAWDEPKDVLKRYAEKERLAQRILLDGGSVADSYGISSVPVTLWINRAGVVVDAELGFGGADAVREKTKKLLTSGQG